jgi:energy-coupling factor transporter transmembrane protein EcfT
MMHPVIRIACFILLIIGLTHSNVIVWSLGLPLLFMLYRTDNSFVATLPLLKRLRWLFLSIFILHLWFSAPEFTWFPSWQGWLQALERVGALIFIVLAAQLLLRTTTRTEIIAALQWWFKPLNQLGLATERVAVRLALVLETVETVQTLYQTQQTVAPNPRYSVRIISQRAAELFNQVARLAEQAPLQTFDIPDILSPPLWQWLYVIAFLLVLWQQFS